MTRWLLEESCSEAWLCLIMMLSPPGSGEVWVKCCQRLGYGEGHVWHEWAYKSHEGSKGTERKWTAVCVEGSEAFYASYAKCKIQWPKAFLCYSSLVGQMEGRWERQPSDVPLRRGQHWHWALLCLLSNQKFPAVTCGAIYLLS